MSVILALEIGYTPATGHFPGHSSDIFHHQDRHTNHAQDWWDRGRGRRRKEDSCTTTEERLHCQDPSYMSHQERPPRPIQSKPNSTTSPAQTSNAASSGPLDVPFDSSRPGQGAGGSMGFPQLRTQTGSPSADSTPSRALGVHSILNPSHPATEGDRNPLSQGSSVLPSISPRTTIPTSHLTFSPRSRKRADPSAQMDDQPTAEPSRSGRRVLTPVSPGQRAASLGQRNNPAAYPSGNTLGNLLVPSESRHFYTAEPGQSHDSEIPPLPIPSLAPRGSASYHLGPESASVMNRPPASTYGYAPGSAPAIAKPSESPNTSQSSYSNVSQTSPQYRFGAPQPTQTYPTQQASHPIYPPGSHASGISESHYTMGQGQTYSMRLDTEHGPITVPVEMDVQQASKVADEKRKRNAGASARFRQRRKEKEKEASVTIASLEKDIKALEDERDFYYGERNFWRDFAARTVGAGQLPPRPRSPAPRRQSIPMSSEGGSVQSMEQGPPEPQPTRTQRRRTGDYQPTFTSGQSAASPMLPPQPPGPQQSYAGQGVGPLPPIQVPYGEARPGPPGQLPPPPNMPTVSRSHSYDNLRPSNLYDRSWNPGR